MIHIHCERGRLHRSSTQSFHIIKTPVNCIFIVFGSSGNAYVVTVSASAITCNCPDKVAACKHILFLLSVCGLLRPFSKQTSVSPVSLLQRMHAEPLPPQLKLALLDNHTTKLCSAHAFPPCFFCAKQPSGTLIICSNCGFLSHKACLGRFLMEDDNASRFNEHCPKCGRLSARFTSNFVNGHRNFSSVLRHQGYATLLPTHQSVGVQHARRIQRRHRTGENNVNHALVSELVLPDLELSANSVDNHSSNHPQLRDV